MDKILSIVVPTYNMEALLPRCLNSLITSQFLKNQIEILIVNDGSTDNSLGIAREYEEQYPQLFRVIDKMNGNYGSCVNTALNIAKGKYFRILDADDWFNTSAFSVYIQQLIELQENVDAVFTNYMLCYATSKNNRVINADGLEYNKIYTFKKLDLSGNLLSKMLCMHAISYNTAFLRQIQLKMQEGISYTDIEYCYFPLVKANKITFFNLNLYQYFLGREGQTMSPTSMIKNKMHSYKVSYRVLNDFINLNINCNSYLCKNLSQIIKNPLHSYYLTILVLEEKDSDDIQTLKDVECIIQENDYLKKLVRNFRYKKFPFVNFWRLTGLRSIFLRKL